MRAPAFWQAGRAGWPSGCSRHSAGFTVRSPWRARKSGERVSIPVIAIGNFTLVARAKRRWRAPLRRRWRRGRDAFHPLARLWRDLPGPHRVEPARDTAAMVGDEPLMLAGAMPVIISRDRRAGAKLAIEQGANILVLDDALHNPHLAKDFTLAVVDGGAGFGNGFCIPAGPLRAPFSPSGGNRRCADDRRGSAANRG